MTSSKQVVPQDIAIDKKIAKQAIEEAFSFSVTKLELMGEGWDNLVFLVNENLVFRFSRRKVAIPLLEREMSLLQKLTPHLPQDIPTPEFLSEGTKAYPFPFYGHRKVKGQTGCSVILSLEEQRQALKDLAHFLKALHRIEISSLTTKEDPLTPVFDRADVPKMIQFFSERLEELKAVKAYDLAPFEEKICEIKEKASQYKESRKKLAFVHGDLYHRHLIFDKDSKLSGVIDWGDSCVSDPNVDLAILFQFFPKHLHREFFEIYGEISEKAYDYIRFLGLYYAVALLWYGHDRSDQELIQSSLRTLEALNEV